MTEEEARERDFPTPSRSGKRGRWGPRADLRPGWDRHGYRLGLGLLFRGVAKACTIDRTTVLGGVTVTSLWAAG